MVLEESNFCFEESTLCGCRSQLPVLKESTSGVERVFHQWDEEGKLRARHCKYKREQ
jgi:hypothetical protein